MDSYVASNGIVFHGQLDLLQKPPLDTIGLLQNQETMALCNLKAVDLIYFIMCEDPTRIDNCYNSIWLRAWAHMTSHIIAIYINLSLNPWSNCYNPAHKLLYFTKLESMLIKMAMNKQTH
jgi:hypothetical protein